MIFYPNHHFSCEINNHHKDEENMKIMRNLEEIRLPKLESNGP